MHRRHLIAGVSLALLPPVAGCIDGGGSATEDGASDDDGGSQQDDGAPAEPMPEEPRVDEPPYDIDPPEIDGGTPDDWNDRYLCENMPDEPSLSVERVSGARLREPPFDLEEGENPSFRVDLARNRDALEAIVDPESIPGTALETVDFDTQAVVVVNSGFGSGSVEHVWKRVEPVENGVHLHGCYTRPLAGTDDYTWRTSILVVERPDTLRLARASLTISETERVHVNSTEGTVSPDI